MQNDYPPQSIEIEARRSLLDEPTGNPETALKAHFAQQFGHVALRHANDEISKTDYNRFHELYVDKLMKHSLVIDRSAVSRDFDLWVDAMLPAAQADIYDALVEQETASLPEFVSPKQMSEMKTSADDKLMHENLRLVEENARFMNQLVGMSKELRNVKSQLSETRQERDNLVIRAGLNHDEVFTES
jgi:hypothetical protein